MSIYYISFSCFFDACHKHLIGVFWGKFRVHFLTLSGGQWDFVLHDHSSFCLFWSCAFSLTVESSLTCWKIQTQIHLPMILIHLRNLDLSSFNGILSKNYRYDFTDLTISLAFDNSSRKVVRNRASWKAM